MKTPAHHMGAHGCHVRNWDGKENMREGTRSTGVTTCPSLVSPVAEEQRQEKRPNCRETWRGALGSFWVIESCKGTVPREPLKDAIEGPDDLGDGIPTTKWWYKWNQPETSGEKVIGGSC